jgi:hypothetical protein
MKEG